MRDEGEIEVVAGIICEEGRLLAGQRKESGLFPGKWEFPGGKVERGEERLAALRRELNEELGITVISAVEVFRYRHKYANEVKVHLVSFIKLFPNFFSSSICSFSIPRSFSGRS